MYPSRKKALLQTLCNPPACWPAAAGMRNMEDLLAAFAAAEDEAYTLFTYVNDVNAEVEKLEDQVNVGRAEVTQALEQVGAAGGAGL
jgi:hypothetical protein